MCVRTHTNTPLRPKYRYTRAHTNRSHSSKSTRTANIVLSCLSSNRLLMSYAILRMHSLASGQITNQVLNDKLNVTFGVEDSYSVTGLVTVSM